MAGFSGRDTEGRFADYSIASGYRQYFWKGLPAEFSQKTEIGILRDHVTTGKTYNRFDWLVSGSRQTCRCRNNATGSRFIVNCSDGSSPNERITPFRIGIQARSR
jgi:hypothetical protein